MTHADQLSFLPEEYLKRKLRRRAVWASAAVVSALGVAIGTMALHADRVLADLEARHAAVVREYAEAAQSFDRARSRNDLHRRIIQRAAVAATLVERVPRSNILAELTNRLPSGVSLAELTLESRPGPEQSPPALSPFEAKKAAIEAKRWAEAPVAPESGKGEVFLRISGLAATDVQVAHYLGELNRSPLFRDVSLLVSEGYSAPGRTGNSMRRFQIQMVVAHDASVIPRPAAQEPVTARLEN